MQRLLFRLTISLFLIAIAQLSQAQTWQPKATPESVVNFHNARFTVITSNMIRLEFSESAQFEDLASLAIVNRQLPTPKFSKKISGNQLRIETQALRLTYIDDGQLFNENNLSIQLKEFSRQTWKPNSQDTKNLKGTMRTLDQISGWDGEAKLENGLISRSGWSLIDDSKNNLFDGDTEWNWVTPRKNAEIDWYFLGYGNHYKQALYDFTQVAGKIPMPPKYAFGYWWSRYWIYNDAELRSLVGRMRDENIPIDVLIIDMDWHETYGFSAHILEKDSQDQLKGWTGYTWNKNLFPEPQKFIEWTNQQELKTALNLHPASGIPTMEEKYSEFVNAYDPKTPKDQKEKDHKEYVPFLMSDKKWAKTYFDVILKPMENWGVDFWWLDWQQFLYDKKIPTLSNTWWLNYTFFSNMEKSGKRPMIFHRWGGLGNHRYPIGFSGDAFTNWDALDFETYFTATAANVGYGYWSHDIGGHINNDKPTDGELYLRWIQFGVMSPILRTHASKISTIERRPWMFPQHFSAMRDAIQFRYALAPYIYAAAHQTYATGVSIVHPLYYDYPNNEQAYIYKTQYLFGDQIIAAPVTTPVNADSQLADKKIWLPEGDWFEYHSGKILKGNQELVRHFAQNDIPLYVKAGAIIPMNPPVHNLQHKPDSQILAIIPDQFDAKKINSSVLYDDDETTPLYQAGQFSERKVTSQMLDKKTLRIKIDAATGHYNNAPSEKIFSIKLLNRSLPKKISISRADMSSTGEFNVEELASVIHLPALPEQAELEVIIEFEQDFDTQNKIFSGNKGFFNRMAQTTERLKFASAQTDWGGTLLDDIYVAGNIQNKLRYNPEKAVELLTELNQLKPQLPSIMHKLNNVSPEIIDNNIQFLDL